VNTSRSGLPVTDELKDGTEVTIGSMEIFRVVDGRITEVWNCGYKQGVWQ
jgi:predicted SnoaL-like aldol condensation-catalyzing enzyme